jgi:hypothetical protein
MRSYLCEKIDLQKQTNVDITPSKAALNIKPCALIVFRDTFLKFSIWLHSFIMAQNTEKLVHDFVAKAERENRRLALITVSINAFIAISVF